MRIACAAHQTDVGNHVGKRLSETFFVSTVIHQRPGPNTYFRGSVPISDLSPGANVQYPPRSVEANQEVAPDDEKAGREAEPEQGDGCNAQMVEETPSGCQQFSGKNTLNQARRESARVCGLEPTVYVRQERGSTMTD